jgi:acyl carrier protein
VRIRRQLRQFVVENLLFGQENGLKDEDSFLESGIIDSTGVLELVAFLEKDFGIKVADSELVPENLDSIDRLAAFIARRLSQTDGERLPS